MDTSFYNTSIDVLFLAFTASFVGFYVKLSFWQLFVFQNLKDQGTVDTAALPLCYGAQWSTKTSFVYF